MKISISFIVDIEDLYKDFLKHLGLSKAQYKKAGFKKNLSFKKGRQIELPCDVLRNGEINPIYSGPEINILHEDENFLAVSKPYGVHGHPLSFSETKTILNFLRDKNKSYDFGGAEKGLLYRLDRETSGILVLAKKEDLYKKIRENFDQFAKEKIYLAIVEGELKDLGRVEHRLKSFGEKGAKQVESHEGNLSKLVIKKTVYNHVENCTLVMISLETGRRHQIRTQLDLLGHPILGDVLYGAKQADRLYLHAYKYSFSWKQESYSFADDRASLFDKFFDLNSCL